MRRHIELQLTILQSCVAGEWIRVHAGLGSGLRRGRPSGHFQAGLHIFSSTSGHRPT
jgi:hypothetical protein